jgi:dihydropteroate synthase
MIKYYTRACNFYYGNLSKRLIKNKQTLPLCGDKEISFDQIEIFLKNNKKQVTSKIINIKKINSLSKSMRLKVILDIKKITSKRKLFGKKNNVLMGILNMTPDSFSDGGKFK